MAETFEEEDASELTPLQCASLPEGCGSHNRFELTNDGNVVDHFSKQQRKYEHMQIIHCVNKNVWPKKKFVVFERELNFGTTLQKFVHQQLHKNVDDAAYWDYCKETVRAALRRKRNNVAIAIKAQMKSKYTTVL